MPLFHSTDLRVLKEVETVNRIVWGVVMCVLVITAGWQAIAQDGEKLHINSNGCVTPLVQHLSHKPDCDAAYLWVI